MKINLTITLFLTACITLSVTAQVSQKKQKSIQHAVLQNQAALSTEQNLKSRSTQHLNWKIQPFDHKLFIQNEGQFDKITDISDKVLYGAQLGRVMVYFTANKLIYQFTKLDSNSKSAPDRISNKEKQLKLYRLEAIWENSNPNVTVTAEGEQQYFYSYTSTSGHSIRTNVFKKITFHDLYPDIDMVCTFPNDSDGFEYSFIVRPGADLSKLKLQYQGANSIILNKEGNIVISSLCGDFTEHLPICFDEQSKSELGARFRLESRNEVCYSINNPHSDRTIIIDPWVTNPSFSNYNAAYDLDYDNSGNVYVYGGAGTGSGTPFQLIKLNSSGVIQWVFNATALSPNPSYGDFTTDKTTYAYLFQGVEGTNPIGQIYQVSLSTGLLVTLKTPTLAGATASGGMNEMWRVSFDQCTGNIIVGGGGDYSYINPGNLPCNEAGVYNPTTNTMTLVNILALNNGDGYQDICIQSLDPSNKSCYMGTSYSNYVPNNINIPDWIYNAALPNLVASSNIDKSSTYTVHEEGTQFVNNNANSYTTNGLNGMTVSPNYFYVWDGYRLLAGNKNTVSDITYALVNPLTPNYGFPNWGGIAVDACDNLYLGDQTMIDEYSFNGSSFTKIGSLSTSGNPVYDVQLGANQQTLYACGKNFVESYDVSGTSNVSLSFTTKPTCASSCNGTAMVNLSLCGTPVTPANFPNLFYSWSPGGQTTQTATGLCAGTYSVSVSLGGCTDFYTGSTTISTAPPLNVSAIGPFGNVCVGTPITLSAFASGGTAPYIYNWSGIGSYNVHTVNINAPSTTTTYTLTVLDANGCTATTTVTVNVDQTCCYQGLNGYAIMGPVNSSTLPTPYNTNLTTTGTSTISGIFTIDNNYSIIGTNVAMGKDAQIIVTPGHTLTITFNSFFQISRLYSCGDMWKGIIVQPGGNLIIQGISNTTGQQIIIEDAITGVEAQGNGNVNISDALLNNNYTDIQFDPGATAILNLNSSTLITEADPGFSNYAYLKAPYPIGTITNSGVYLNNAYGITVGNSGSGKNIFSNMNYGVYALNTNFIVYNNDFNTLKALPYGCVYPHVCPIIGIAIYANGTTGTPGANYFAIIGGTSPPQINTMENVYRGIDITGYADVEIRGNQLTNTNNTVPHFVHRYGDHAILLDAFVYYPSNLTYTYLNYVVNNNTINNFYTGIHVIGPPNAYPVGCNPCPIISGPANINGNTLSTSGGGSMTTGILCENPVGLSSLTTAPQPYITYNTVTNATYAGIQLKGILNYILPCTIDHNSIQIYPTKGASDPSHRSGILLQNSTGYFVSNNSVSSPGVNLLKHYKSKADTTVVGIRTILSNGTYACNGISDVGQCMRFEGSCYPSQLFNNSFTTPAFEGLTLLSSAIIGQQGSNTASIGETWNGSFLNDGTYSYYSFPGTTTPTSDLWVNKTPSNYDPSNAGNGYSPISPPNLSSPFQISDGSLNYTTSPTPVAFNCPVVPPIASGGTSQLQQLMHQIVQDSIPFSAFVQQSQYLSQQATLNQITDSAALMNGDTVLQNFYANSATTNMGAAFAIDTLIAKGKASKARSMNAVFVPSNLIEQNHKDVNDIFLSTVADSIDTLSVIQYNKLMDIAQQCPLQGGRAVFEARTLLNKMLRTNLVFPDYCDPSSKLDGRIAGASKTLSTNIPNINIYPNPANTILTIVMQLQTGQTANICLYNSLGENIKCETLTSNSTTINTSNLASGIYYYRITDNSGNLLKADKQMITH